MLIFTSHIRDGREMKRSEINVSFIASEKAVDKNDNSLEKCRKISLELLGRAAEFRSNYMYNRVPQNFH